MSARTNMVPAHCGRPPRVTGYGLRGCESEPGAREGMCCCGCIACDLVCVIRGSRAPSFTRSYTTVAALFVQGGGCYSKIPWVDPWDEKRDARKYGGPWPVVAHPPCNLWVKFARVNFQRWGGEHNRPGNDAGCFASALQSVRMYGGVLEHPAESYAWTAHDLPHPSIGWTRSLFRPLEWVCEVWQSAYGHRARKRTWLLYVGRHPPTPLRWHRVDGACQIGWFDRNKQPLGKREASATPPAFRDALIALAERAALFSCPSEAK